MQYYDPICALSTPSGSGAIALVRASGERVIEKCASLIRFSQPDKNLLKQKAGTLHLASFESDGQQLDEVMVAVFRTPHSYTGEDMVEIYCHGSVYIQQQILLALIHRGIRTAQPGEFTMRAFMNGKMDLAQAESVADLIAAESAAAHRIALNQLKGTVSDKIRQLRGRLLDFSSLIELELDFGEEDVEFADRSQLLTLAGEIRQTLRQLAGSFRQGRAMKNGIPVTIAGDPNTGKSTLLNVLLQEEKAIVSEIPGTTRDFIEDTITLDGYLFRFIDTAGLRSSEDVVEKKGIDRTWQKIRQAYVIILLADWQMPVEKIKSRFEEINSMLDNENQYLILVINKTDTADPEQLQEIKKKLQSFAPDPVFISALKETHLEELKARLKKAMHIQPPGEQEVIISSVRHYEALIQAGEAIGRVINGLQEGLPSDLVAQDLREAIHYMGEITGEITTDEILENIFAKFCIGK